MNIPNNQTIFVIFQSLSELNISELDEVMQQILVLRRKKNRVVLSENETELLRKINIGIPASIQKRYAGLVKKRAKETISEMELDELFELTEFMEARTAKRLAYLIELAKLRNQTLDETLMQLDIKPKLYVA